MARRDDRLYIQVTLDALSPTGKLAGAHPGAKWLWLSGLIVSRRDLLDGIIRPATAAAEAEVPVKHAKELDARGLWHNPGHGCDRCPQPPSGLMIIHDYPEHNQTRADVEAMREKRSAAGRRGADSRWHGTRDGKADSKSHSNSDGKSHGKTDATTMAETERETELAPDGANESEAADQPSAEVVHLHPEVEALCTHLADRIEANGSKRPQITAKWRDAARLMLDRDNRTEAQVRAAIDWCQDDEFWRTNILSMPKLREQYDRLRLAAQRGRTAPTPRQQETDGIFERAAARMGVTQ